MKITIKAALVFALIWIIAVLSIYLMGYSIDLFLPVELFGLFTLLGAIFTGLFLTKKEQGYDDRPALDDFKTAMQSGLLYTVIITVFIYFYHESIDPSIRENFAEERIAAIHTMYPDQEAYAVLQSNDPTWREKSFDDFIENQEIQAKSFLSPKFTSLIHLFLLFMFSLFYSFFVMLVIRKVILRPR
jgi:ABC-type multidrug transport system fused ATPase/permease subunit